MSAATVEDKIKFQIPFCRTAVTRLKKNGRKTVCRLVKKMAVPFNRVTILIFLVHCMSRSKKYLKKIVYPIKCSDFLFTGS